MEIQLTGTVQARFSDSVHDSCVDGRNSTRAKVAIKRSFRPYSAVNSKNIGIIPNLPFLSFLCSHFSKLYAKDLRINQT